MPSLSPSTHSSAGSGHSPSLSPLCQVFPPWGLMVSPSFSSPPPPISPFMPTTSNTTPHIATKIALPFIFLHNKRRKSFLRFLRFFSESNLGSTQDFSLSYYKFRMLASKPNHPINGRHVSCWSMFRIVGTLTRSKNSTHLAMPAILKDFLQLHGESTLGDVRIEVYHPVEVGDLTIQCWRKKDHRENQRSREVTFGASIYRNGRVLQRHDPSLRRSPWARKAYEGKMCRRDLETMLDELSCFLERRAGDEPRV